MKIAIPTDTGKVAEHFGRAPKYTIVEIKNGEIKEKKEIENPGHKPGYLPKFLNEKGINLMLVRGIGKRAISLFKQYNIDLETGIEGGIDEVIEKCLNEELNGSKNPCKPGKGKGHGVEKQE